MRQVLFLSYLLLFLKFFFILTICHFISAWKRKFFVLIASHVDGQVTERKSLYELE